MFTEEIRVRFAPSPTGYLHIGGVRTALYNYLFAKNKGGKFILRIEDTDISRSDEIYTDVIMSGMKWLGLDWDDGPYFQSQRHELYNAALKKLLEEGNAYKCYCTPEELKEKRETALKEGRNMGYDGKCRELSLEEENRFTKEERKFAYRIKSPKTGTIAFEDMIKGRIEIAVETVGDFIIVKSDGMPTYNFACAVDDANLGITHIIRGDDHISNTPKQIIVYDMLGIKVPQFAHLPQVHGSDGKKLSKRTGAVSLEEYKEKGYLPEALRNYLALLGWSTEDSQQLFKWEELIDKFDIKRCSSSSGIFDMEKLDWMNGKYIRDLPVDELVKNTVPWLKESGLIENEENISEKIFEVIELEQEKINLLSEIPGRIDFIVKDDIEYDEKSVNKRLKKEGVRKILTEIKELLNDTYDFSGPVLEEKVRIYCEEQELGAGKVFHPVRVAVSGRMQGPGLFELLEVLGKDKVIKRIDNALENYVE